jgi:hypothetical protein
MPINPEVKVSQYNKLKNLLEQNGHSLLDTEYTKAASHYKVLCSDGHYCYPTAMNLFSGKSPCLRCANSRQLRKGEDKFLTQLTLYGYTPEFDEYTGSKTSYAVRCSEGHVTRKYPGTLSRNRHCKVCYSKKRVASTEVKFLQRMQELGASPNYSAWRGTHYSYEVTCAEGHNCFVDAHSVLGGQGICLTCVGKLWNRVYIVVNEDEELVKVGITSGDANRRLKRHREVGFQIVTYLSPVLEEGKARQTELYVLRELKLDGQEPVKGLEYFDISLTSKVKKLVKEYISA